MIVVALNVSAQNSEWGIRVAPAFSKARNASGYGMVYPGPPFWSGSLRVEEKQVGAFAIEAFREAPTRYNKIAFNTSIGFLTCGAFQHFSYDYANSVNNIISIEKRYHYISLGTLAKRNFGSGKWNPFVGLGPHFGMIIRSLETSINWVNEQERSKATYNFLAKERKTNLGAQYYIGVASKRIKLDLFYRSYYRIHHHHFGKRVFACGLGVSYAILQME